jgi:ElaB/YqjD/DUF883 family membrane-anchored ribosome-binding protein
MSKHTQEVHDDMNALAEDARALMTATANVAGDQVAEARQRLAAALDRGRNFYDRVRDKTVARVRATDDAVHEHPYQVMGVAFGLGALIGYLATRRCGRNGD